MLRCDDPGTRGMWERGGLTSVGAKPGSSARPAGPRPAFCSRGSLRLRPGQGATPCLSPDRGPWAEVGTDPSRSRYGGRPQSELSAGRVPAPLPVGRPCSPVPAPSPGPDRAWTCRAHDHRTGNVGHFPCRGERTRALERRERPPPVPAFAHSRRRRRTGETGIGLPACTRAIRPGSRSGTTGGLDLRRLRSAPSSPQPWGVPRACRCSHPACHIATADCGNDATCRRVSF